MAQGVLGKPKKDPTRHRHAEDGKVEPQAAFLVEQQSQKAVPEMAEAEKGGEGFVVGAQGGPNAVEGMEINRQGRDRQKESSGQLAPCCQPVLILADLIEGDE